jgi:hypothetical protein
MNDVLETLKKLPEICASRHPTTGEAVLLRRGSIGYWPAGRIDPDKFNERHGVTAAQLEAMEIGSHFGFDVPGADPDQYA